MVDGREPDAGLALGAGGIGGQEHTFTFHAGLTIYDPQGSILPHIAHKVPSVEEGDWQVFPDGRMEVTWRIRPDVKWHDGTPATASDFVFGLGILQDREMPFARSRAATLISNVTAPDPHTLVVNWRQPYTLANVSGPTDIPAVPAHLLGDIYAAGDKQAVINNQYWTRQFVGLGPYRLGDWLLGSHIEALAFDSYFLGRPKIDRLIIRYVGDANVLYATLLAGDVDAITFGSFQADHFVMMKQDWEARGSGTALAVYSGTRNYRFQLRDPSAPWGQDVRVRRALIQMIDRQALAESLIAGLASPADVLVSPGDPIYRLVEQRGLTRYPYDASAAQRLLGDAGWTRSPDGSYRSSRGEPFAIDVKFTDYVANVKEGEAVAAQWRASGLQTTTGIVPDNAPSAVRNEMRHTFTGVLAGPLRDTHEALEAFITSQIGTQNNRWVGANRGGYSNPAFDALYDRSLVTLNAGEREGLIADMLKIEVDDAVSMHLFYDMQQQTLAFRKGVRGPGPVAPVQLATSWNIHTWEID
jgi:peptide/nickel transport system substrate-binding protein